MMAPRTRTVKARLPCVMSTSLGSSGAAARSTLFRPGEQALPPSSRLLSTARIMVRKKRARYPQSQAFSRVRAMVCASALYASLR